jgi:hypothetical protein
LKDTVQGRVGVGWHPPLLVTVTRGGWLGDGVAVGEGSGVGVALGDGVGVGGAATGGRGNVGPEPSHEERSTHAATSPAALAPEVMESS